MSRRLPLICLTVRWCLFHVSSLIKPQWSSRPSSPGLVTLGEVLGPMRWIHRSGRRCSPPAVLTFNALFNQIDTNKIHETCCFYSSIFSMPSLQPCCVLSLSHVASSQFHPLRGVGSSSPSHTFHAFSPQSGRSSSRPERAMPAHVSTGQGLGQELHPL